MSTQKTELIRTSQSWDGAELADYLPAAVGSAGSVSSSVSGLGFR